MAKSGMSGSTTDLGLVDEVDLKQVKKQAQRDVLAQPEMVGFEEGTEEITGKAPKTIYEITQSPFERGDRNGMLRKRTGFHQTWINDTDVEYYKEVGYFHIRKPKVDDKPGQETGEVIKRNEGKDRWQYAMEVSLDLYNRHLDAVVAKSHAAYTSQSDVMREYVDKTNRDLGSKMEVLEEKEDFAEEVERIERKR